MSVDIISLQPEDSCEEAFELSTQGGSGRVEVREYASVAARVNQLRDSGIAVRVFTLSDFRSLLQHHSGSAQLAEKQLELQAAQLGFT